MWIEGNYRRIFLDMHIDDWNEGFLAKVDPQTLVALVAASGAQQVVIKCRPHTGLAHYPTHIGRMHSGLCGRDYVAEMLAHCKASGLATMGYFSQIFDNMAYDEHPDWRCVNGLGKVSRECADYASPSLFRRGRYGIVCPNSEGYRTHVRDCLTEIVSNYAFDSIFLDMPFWPEVCYCEHCRTKYQAQTGREMPREIDWHDAHFRQWQALREDWMGEFTSFATRCVKDVNPLMTVEHNASNISASWQTGTTDLVADASDYVGGDLFGGYLEQTFICKYYRNLSKALPFNYITSLCDPDLNYHTSIKVLDELLLHGITALVHGGAFSICDGINPDGCLRPRIYRDVIAPAFAQTAPYEPFVGGEMISNAAIWFSSRAKYDMEERGGIAQSADAGKDRHPSLENALGAAGLLRDANIPFTVMPDAALEHTDAQLWILPDIAHISDENMRTLEAHLARGGNLYISGHLGHPRILELLEARDLGMTAHDVTYISPTEAGMRFFSDFDEQSPMAVQGRMQQLELRGDCELLGTITLPATLPGTYAFSAIHSNPPWEQTKMPAALIKSVGAGRIFWVAAPIERTRPYTSRLAVMGIMRALTGPLSFHSDAPSCVEVVGWKKDGAQYYAAINQQERMPVVPMPSIELHVPYAVEEAVILTQNRPLPLRVDGQHSVITLPPLQIFHILRVR